MPFILVNIIISLIGLIGSTAVISQAISGIYGSTSTIYAPIAEIVGTLYVIYLGTRILGDIRQSIVGLSCAHERGGQSLSSEV
jgi:hypothetical protein